MTDTFKDQLLHGMTIRESATDGSDFTNPAADYRRLFLGEDGQLHVKDSAGAVTDIGVSSGSVATDAIWDTAGDLAVGTGANTAAKLAIGAAGGHVSRINGAVAWNSGTSFPGAAATGDRYWRTDRMLEYYYDGTRWLTTQLFSEPVNVTNGVVTTSGTIFGRMATWASTYDLWLHSWHLGIFTGVTNTGSVYWTFTLKKYQNDFTTNSTIVTQDSSAQGTSVGVAYDVAIGALLTPATYKILSVEGTKTGSPSGVHYWGSVVYRLVG